MKNMVLPMHSGEAAIFDALQFRTKSQQHWNIISPLKPEKMKRFKIIP